jgi:hypothetical protein
MKVEPEDIYRLALVIDDCSKFHVEFAEILATIQDRYTLLEAIQILQAYVARNRGIYAKYAKLNFH